MADQPQYVTVTMKGLFVAHGEVFRPGVKYHVTTDIYEGTLPDDVKPEDLKGKSFKDFCATAEPSGYA